MQASITGHSMGGHGALVLGLRNPGLYRSISALAPISSPSQAPWDQKGDSEQAQRARTCHSDLSHEQHSSSCDASLRFWLGQHFKVLSYICS